MEARILLRSEQIYRRRGLEKGMAQIKDMIYLGQARATQTREALFEQLNNVQFSILQPHIWRHELNQAPIKFKDLLNVLEGFNHTKGRTESRN